MIIERRTRKLANAGHIDVFVLKYTWNTETQTISMVGSIENHTDCSTEYFKITFPTSNTFIFEWLENGTVPDDIIVDIITTKAYPSDATEEVNINGHNVPFTYAYTANKARSWYTSRYA